MKKVLVFSKDHCPLCDEAESLMKGLQTEFSFDLQIIDIYEDDALLEKYQLMIPVIVIDGEEADYGQVSETKIRTYFQN